MKQQKNRQISNAMVWSKTEDITSSDRTRYEDLVMLPEISDCIDTVFIRGIRDPAYKIETVNFESIDALYGILQFNSEQDKASGYRFVFVVLTN